jgi:predicted transposase YdaD
MYCHWYRYNCINSRRLVAHILREGEREGGREGGREGEREGGREGGREEGREGGKGPPSARSLRPTPPQPRPVMQSKMKCP